MPEYAKLKNADLEAMLRERGLPHGGKKADMVERLTKDDDKKAAEAVSATTKLHPEDEIDWDDEGDDAVPAVTAKTAAATSTDKEPSVAATQPDTVAKVGGTEQSPNPQADIDTSKTTDLAVKALAGDEGTEAKTEVIKEPTPDYTQGIAATDLDAEIEKRKARAKRFGLKVEDDDSLKKLERAKKFGGSGPPNALDEALPERRKRGREDYEDGGRNKRRGGGRGGPRGRGGHRDNDRRREDRDNRREDRGTRGGNGTNWMSAADREKAEARKAKWAKPAAAS